MKKIKISTGLIEGRERLKLHFEYDQEIISLVKQIPGARWHPAERCWHVSVLAGGVEKLNARFKGKLEFEEDGKAVGLHDGKTVGMDDSKCEILEEVVKLMVMKNYSENTIRTYRQMLSGFLSYYAERNPKEITEEEIRAYLIYLITQRDVSTSYQNQAINAIKLYYEQVEGRPVRKYYIQRPKKEKTLPNVLSEQEVQAILNATVNLKHRSILSLIYSAGLRRGELINLKINDIDSKRMYVIIRQGKGMKDRYSILSERVLEMLRNYFTEYKPKEWLFEGQFGGQYSETSIQNILKAALGKAGIKKRVTVHTLRHCFATHLLERGVDIRYIQELLGHKSPKTTEIYTHITQRGLGKIKSPLDQMDI